MDLQTDRKRVKETSANDPNKLDLRSEIQEAHRSHSLSWPCWVFEHLDLPEQARILEVGCGSGSLWQENRQRISSGWQLLLSDRYHSNARITRSRLAGLHQVSHITCLDGQYIPFANESFDAVLAIGVLDLIPEPERALNEAWRVLRPSGQFITSAGGREHLLEMRELLREYLPSRCIDRLGGETARFGLGNGLEHLARHFEEVVQHDYMDQMTFSELPPILDYILSEDTVIQNLNQKDLVLFVQNLKSQFSIRGQIKVQVRKGIFVARKKIVHEEVKQGYPTANQ